MPNQPWGGMHDFKGETGSGAPGADRLSPGVRKAAVLERTTAIERAAAEVVKAEAQGQSWLQRTWRPITMFTFVALIVARWLGWSAPGLAEAEALKLWDIGEIGLGGYVIGRSAEKLLPGIVDSMKKS